MDSVTQEIVGKASQDVQLFDGTSFRATDVYIITWDGVVVDSWYYSWWAYYYNAPYQRCTAQDHVSIVL